jgi:hypothetical protein
MSAQDIQASSSQPLHPAAVRKAVLQKNIYEALGAN